MSQRFDWLAVWLLTGIVAALSCGMQFTAAHVGDQYVPVGNDSFYHARRILDTANDPAAFFQFDDKIHAPEGSLLVWPWGYDYALAMVVRAGVAVGLSSDPMAILAWIPLAAVFINIGLLILIARRLQLTPWPSAIAALCMALAPTTQLLHGPGELDHHFAELMFLLPIVIAVAVYQVDVDRVVIRVISLDRRVHGLKSLRIVERAWCRREVDFGRRDSE